MTKRLCYILIIISFNSLLYSQNNIPNESFKLKKETIRCLENPHRNREILYEYSNGEISKITYYLDEDIESWVQIEYNQFCNEIQKVSFNAKNKVITTNKTTYDDKQRIKEKRIFNDFQRLKTIYKYDSLSRIISEEYFRNPQSNISCHKILYEYLKGNLIKKVFYSDCMIKSYEENVFDNQNKKVKTEIFKNGKLYKYVVYEYNDNNQLKKELTYSIPKKGRLTSEKRYIYNENGKLIEVYRNDKLIEKNHFMDDRLVKKENFNPYMIVPRAGHCEDKVILYEYY